jgi:cobalt-zinc-cadmium resistance protein CzcA
MFEKIIRFSVRHRFLVIMLTLLVGGYGLLALFRLPIDAVPDITNQQVQINAIAQGLSPFDIEKQVTFPIENALAGIPGLEGTRSISRSGFSQVTAIFKDSTDIYFARSQINERLMEAKESLPPGVEPKMGPISTGLGEVYMWSVDYKHPFGKEASVHPGEPGWQNDGTYLTPEGISLKNPVELASYLRTVQDWIIRPQLKKIEGLADIDSIGGYIREYHITPDPAKMISLGVSFSDLAEALEANNLSTGAGFIILKDEAYVVKADSRVKNFAEIGDLAVRVKDGIPVRIKDVAHVGIGEELRTGSASKDGHETVIGTAMMLVGANSRTVSSAVHEKLKEISRNLPEDIAITPILNRTKLVDATIKTVLINLFEGAILVVLVLFFLLNNIRAALITAAVIPLSLLIMAIGMWKFKISGNLMSLGALDFGLIVDGAIIITENCLRRLGKKQKIKGRVLTLKEREEGVIHATKEMIQPSVFGQAIIMIVYVPILALQGIEGKMFHPMALTVIFALIAAFILSLTFVPAMIAACVSRKIHEKESCFLLRIKNYYVFLLEKMAPHRIVWLLGGTLIVGLSSLLFFQLGQEFVPTLDERDIAMHALRIPGTSLDQSSRMQHQVENVLIQHPEVDYVFSKTGTAEAASDPMPPNVSDTFIILKPKEQWPNPSSSKEELIERIEQSLQHLPGNLYEFTQPIEMRFNELIAGTRGDLAIKLYGDDYGILEKVGGEISQTLRKIPGSEDVSVTQADGQPTLEVTLNSETMGRLGLRGKDIMDVVSTAIGGSRVGTLFEGDRRFDIFVRLPQAMRHDLAALDMLPVVLPDRERGHVSFPYVPLKEVANLKLTQGVNEIDREDGKRVFIIQANVRGRDLHSFVQEAKEKINALSLPPGYWISWGGQFENLESARRELMVVVPLCFLIIFFLLYTALRSIKYAILVFSGVPLAITGGIVALWLRDITFSISAAVGFIALSGIAVLNGLVLVTYINQLLKKGIPYKKAIIRGAFTRLRPVLMTALVASLGFIPMALSTTAGAEVQRPLATVIIGGLISSTLLTLFIIPLSMMQLSKKKKKAKTLKIQAQLLHTP